jgi:hypothetical protein
MLIATACSNDTASNDLEDVTLEVYASIETKASTRLGITTTEFAKDAQISVFASEGGDVTSYTYTAVGDGTFSSTNGYHFNSEEAVTFFAYYPAVSSDEVTMDLTKQDDNLDLLVSQNTTALMALPTVNFTFKHVMSKLTFVLSDGGGFSSFKGATVTLEGISQTTGTFYPKQQLVVNEKQDSGTITAIFKAEESSENEEESPAAGTAEVLLFPTTKKESFTLKITLGGNDYTKELSLTPSAGNNYRYEVTVTQQGLTISSPIITAWDNVIAKEDLSMTVPTTSKE